MTVRSARAGAFLALLGVLLVALSLRTPVAALSPILGRVGEEIPLDAVTLAIVGALPPLAFAAAGLFTPLVSRRWGLERTLVLALGAMVAGHLGRAFAPEGAVLAFSTAVVLVGVGVGNVLLPPIVRRYFPHRVGFITSLYATLMSLSTGFPALLAVPIADAAGWRVSLAVWASLSVIAAIPWLPLLPRSAGETSSHPSESDELRRSGAEPGRLGLRMLRSPTAWSIGIVFGSSSLGAYACFAWLPALLSARAGLDEAQAGALLALYSFMGLPAAILVPILVARRPSFTAPLVLLAAVFFATGYLGLLFAPTAAPVLWVASAGLGPLLFPLALVLINLRSAAPRSTIALSGFVQTVGYLFGAMGPFVVGLLHDASEGWTVPLVFLLVVVAGVLPAAAVLARGRRVDEEI